MTNQRTKETIKKELSKIIHPEINCSLVELGMIKDIKVNRKVLITLNLPFLEVPIKDDLINLIKNTIKKIDKEKVTEVNVIEMNEKERKKFMRLAQER